MLSKQEVRAQMRNLRWKADSFVGPSDTATVYDPPEILEPFDTDGYLTAREARAFGVAEDGWSWN